MRTVLRTAALALALAFFAGSQAVAMTAPLGDGLLSPGDNGTVSNAYGADIGFEDFYTFQVDTTSNFSANIFNFNINTEFLDWDLSSLTVSFEKSSDGLGGWSIASSQTVSNGSGIGDINFLVSYANLLPTEFYRLRIAGTTLGEQGGGYFGNYKVAAVPLPPAVVLFGLGLVAVFGISRRMKTAA